MVKQNSEYLANESPIPLFPALARAFGEQKALIIQQIRFWMNHYQRTEQILSTEQRRHFQQDRWWVYNTYKDWEQTNFDWIPGHTLRRLISQLEGKGVLLSGEFNRAKGDRTKWYSIDFDQLDKLIAENEAGWAKKKADQKAERKARYAKRKPSDQPDHMPVHSDHMGDQPDRLIPETTTDNTLPLQTTTPVAEQSTAIKGSHPSIQAFREAAHRYPAKSWYEKIGVIIGSEEASVKRWGDLVLEWVGRGYNPSNVSGMLNAFQSGGLQPNGSNGNGHHPDKSQSDGINHELAAYLKSRKEEEQNANHS